MDPRAHKKIITVTREFEIGDAEPSAEQDLIAGFIQGLAGMNRPQASDEKAPPAPSTERAVLSAKFVKVYITVATQAWKLKSRMIDPATQEPKEECRRFYRHVESILESLSEIGIQVRDRTNEVFDYGLPEKVIGTQPTPGISKERVIETIKPSIYWNQHLVQVGEVVLATPTGEVARPGA